MRALTTNEMMMLYKFTKASMIAGGIILLGYGSFRLFVPMIFHLSDSFWLFWLFPIYVGAMLILVALAMKEDWFTNARHYW